MDKRSLEELLNLHGLPDGDDGAALASMAFPMATMAQRWTSWLASPSKRAPSSSR